jgi:DHA2 family multidrug resistance protein
MARAMASASTSKDFIAPFSALAGTRPYFGLGAVLLGAFVSTLNGRLSTFGLADIRGALGLSVDEAAWITTAQSVAQMLIGPVAIWAGAVFGTRRVLLAACLVFATASALIPFVRGIDALLALQFVGGLGTGCFVPLTITFIVRNLPPKYWAIGIAMYALNIEASLNVSASVEGFYADHASWAWIFWQSVPLAVAMAFCVHIGIPDQPVNFEAARNADVFGMASASFGFALVYAALDQGNRLDWLNSGLVVALLIGGGLLLVAFVVRELRAPNPWINIRMVARGYLPIMLLLVSEIRFASLATAYLVPQYMTVVRGFRAPEVGSVLMWIAIPQLITAPLAAFLLRIVDARWVAMAGLGLIGVACLITSTHLTTQWSTADFLATQLMQALGQTCAISAVIFVGILHLKPADAPTFGALLQIARLFGGELGLAFIVTFVRTREQFASHVFGVHVQSGALDTLARLQTIAGAIASRAEAAGAALARATGLLAQAVRTQANLQSYVEGFAVIAASTVVALLLLVILDPPPRGPASHDPSLARIRWGRRP